MPDTVYLSLKALTGHEAGVILFDDGYMWLGNWEKSHSILISSLLPIRGKLVEMWKIDPAIRGTLRDLIKVLCRITGEFDPYCKIYFFRCETCVISTYEHLP